MSDISYLKTLADNEGHYSNVLERAVQSLYNDADLASSMRDYERAGELSNEADAVFAAMMGIQELAELKQKGKL